MRRKRKRSRIRVPKRSVRLKRIIPLLIKVGIAILILGAFIHLLDRFNEWVLSLEELRVKRLNIHGDYPKRARIRKEFERYCLKEHEEKRPNILMIDLMDLKEELEKIPEIKSVKIQRRLPDTLDIVVEKRVPDALIPSKDSFLGCDEWGLFDIDPKERYDLPFITGKESEARERALRMIKRIGVKTPQLLPRISEVNASCPNGLYLYTIDGTRVLFGNTNGYEFDSRLRELCRLLDYLERENLPSEYIDLRFDRIVIKPKGD